MFPASGTQYSYTKEHFMTFKEEHNNSVEKANFAIITDICADGQFDTTTGLGTFCNYRFF